MSTNGLWIGTSRIPPVGKFEGQESVILLVYSKKNDSDVCKNIKRINILCTSSLAPPKIAAQNFIIRETSNKQHVHLDFDT